MKVILKIEENVLSFFYITQIQKQMKMNIPTNTFLMEKRKRKKEFSTQRRL